MKKTMIVSAVLALMAVPVLAEAGPSAGIDYTDVGISGHAGRPGVSVNLGNVYRGNVVADGSATFASGFYQMDASIGKLIPADGLSFEPYLSADFLSLNDNQAETGYHTTTTTSGGGFGYPPVTYSYTTPYSYTESRSIQDFYGLAGVNMSIPLSRKVTFGLGGGYGHTIGVYGGASGGSVYTGDALASFQIAPRVTTDLQVQYQHVPGTSMTDYSVGFNYHF
ncbi:MAG: hypothetical protein ACYCRF_02235 [Acidithiobacillus sp.]